MYRDMQYQKSNSVATKKTIKSLEEFFKQNSHPSRQEQAQLAKDLGLETNQVKNWFNYREAQRTWVCNKLKDPSYLDDMSFSVKEAIEFSKEFKETRQRLGYSLRDIRVQSQQIPGNTLYFYSAKFENLQLNENWMVKYHATLTEWMANLPGPKEKSRNRKLLAKHRDYLQQVFDAERGYPTSEFLREIVDHTGISEKSLRNWFGHMRLLRKRQSP